MRLGRAVVATLMACVGLSTSAAAQRVDSFDAGRTHQTLDHFGAHDSWTGQAYGAWSPTARAAMSEALFSRDAGIGLSGWYYHAAAGIDPTIAAKNYPWNLRSQASFANGDGTYDWSRNAATGALLADAKAHGVERYMMVVYSPPTHLTRNGKPYPDAPSGGNNLIAGGEQAFATYMADVLDHFANHPDPAQRVAFDYVSPLNEPQYNWSGGSQSGNGYLSAADIRAQIIALDNELAARGLDVGIRGPESGSIKPLSQGENYINRLARQADTSGRLGETLTYHSYWSDNDADLLTTRRALANAIADRLPGWDVWQTEYCILGNNASSGLGGPGNDLSMTTALAVARTLHFDLTVANTSAWSYWLAATPYEHNYKDGLIYFDQATQTFEVAKVGWALGHYARFIRPGAERIGFAGPNNDIDGLLVNAWRHDQPDAEGDLTLVYTNQLTTDEAVTHDFANTSDLKDDYFTPFVTNNNAGVSIAEQSPFLIGQPYTVPARSMVTLVGGTFNEDNTGKTFPTLVGDRDYTLGSGLLTLNEAQGTYAGSLDGAGGLIIRSVGTWTLTGDSTHTGDTVVERGTLALAGTANTPRGRLGPGTTLVVRDAGTVRVGGVNALGGYVPANAPSVRLETGGTLTTADGQSVNLGPLTVAGGTLDSGAPDAYWGTWTVNAGVVAEAGTASVIAAQRIQLRGEQTFTIGAGGTLRFTGSIQDFAGEVSSTLVKAGPGTLELAAATPDAVRLSQGVTALIAPGQGGVALHTDALTIDAGAMLDVRDDAALVGYNDASPIDALIGAARDGGLITSVIGQRVAVVEADALSITSVAGVPIDDTTLLLRAALPGDFNLDDRVDADDVRAMLDHYCQTGDGWVTGDSDYDGLVGYADLLALAGDYTGPGIDAFPDASDKFFADWNRAFSVPAPATGAGLALGLLAALRRRRP